MLNFDVNDAAKAAVAIVQAGVANGSIKLNGSGGTEDGVARNAKHDAMYLSELINQLADGLKDQ